MQHGVIDVSVITPTCCREREICDAVRSVLAQQGVAVESIVVDDSETGSARDAVEGIHDSRVRYFKRELASKGRPALARNDGVRYARGRYISFLDDDDQLMPGCLRDMVSALDHSPRVGVAVGRVVSFGSDADVLRVNDDWAHRAARMAARTSGR